MTGQHKLLLATNNLHKAREYSMLLGDIPFQLTTLSQEGINTVVEETGASMRENAEIKACAYASLSGLTTMADDSGLEVDALGKMPGYLSSRFGGEGLSDKQRTDYLLSELKDVPWDKRGASFRCVIAIIQQGESNPLLCHGECRGIITLKPCGKEGFGYDPVFYLPEMGKTMAELSSEEKNRISHRGQAAREASIVLKNISER
ncbi:MAG: RdgB/HAM1 family non-canonical purine NTP pyrophosphatase [Dehalococcoidia bacterium]|nr:RdgB/HAM1 family non-canonical purine NTP pyrophosphatase [Dehalococcoidia bacterium]